MQKKHGKAKLNQYKCDKNSNKKTKLLNQVFQHKLQSSRILELN